MEKRELAWLLDQSTNVTPLKLIGGERHGVNTWAVQPIINVGTAHGQARL